MARIYRHAIRCYFQLPKLMSRIRKVGIVAIRGRVKAFELGVDRFHAPENAVEGAIFQHEYDNVFYRIVHILFLANIAFAGSLNPQNDSAVGPHWEEPGGVGNRESSVTPRTPPTPESA